MLGGSRKGVEGFDCYDAACAALALLDEGWGRLDGFTFNSEGREKLYGALGMMTNGEPPATMEELADLTAQLGIKPGSVGTPKRPTAVPDYDPPVTEQPEVSDG